VSRVVATEPRPAPAPSARVVGGARRVPLLVLVIAVVLLIGSVIAVPWMVRSASSPADVTVAPSRWTDRGWNGGMMGGGMMGGEGAGMRLGRLWLAGDGVPVASISVARARATLASASAGLHPGEIMQFTDNFYVELKDSSGASITEVLVSPATGAVSTEPGPAMMWNTGSPAASVTSDQAKAIATRWLQANRVGETVAAIDAYPGYYTADTEMGDRTVGMLSVNATTGAVWYHTWHGSFVAEQDA